jgi:hypothetical protein
VRYFLPSEHLIYIVAQTRWAEPYRLTVDPGSKAPSVEVASRTYVLAANADDALLKLGFATSDGLLTGLHATKVPL